MMLSRSYHVLIFSQADSDMDRALFTTSMKFGMRLPWVKPKNFRYGATLKSYPEANGSHFSKWPPEENLQVLANL